MHREEPLLLISALFCTRFWPQSSMKVRRNFPCSEKTAGVHLLFCTLFYPINSFSHYISHQALQLWCTLKFLLHRESVLCSSMSATPSDTCDVPPALALYQGVSSVFFFSCISLEFKWEQMVLYSRNTKETTPVWMCFACFIESVLLIW